MDSGGLQSMGLQRVGHNRATKTWLTQTHYVQSKTQILKISLYLSCLPLKFPKQSAFLCTPYFVERPTITWWFKFKSETHIPACINHNLCAILYPNCFFTFPFLTTKIMRTPTVLTIHAWTIAFLTSWTAFHFQSMVFNLACLHLLNNFWLLHFDGILPYKFLLQMIEFQSHYFLVSRAVSL